MRLRDPNAAVSERSRMLQLLKERIHRRVGNKFATGPDPAELHKQVPAADPLFSGDKSDDPRAQTADADIQVPLSDINERFAVGARQQFQPVHKLKYWVRERRLGCVCEGRHERVSD